MHDQGDLIKYAKYHNINFENFNGTKNVEGRKPEDWGKLYLKVANNLKIDGTEEIQKIIVGILAEAQPTTLTQTPVDLAIRPPPPLAQRPDAVAVRDALGRSRLHQPPRRAQRVAARQGARPPTHSPHMSHPTFPISHILFSSRSSARRPTSLRPPPSST